MFCKKCGTQHDDSAKFCPKCGNSVIENNGAMGDFQIPKKGFRHDITKIWPEWEIEKQLGRGSYGVVYQVVRKDSITNLETKAAVKVISIPADASEADSLRSEGIGEEGSRTYFKRIVDGFVSEIRLMDSLKGTQNIVSVEDYKVVEKADTIGWDIYIRMELLTPFNSYMQNHSLSEAEVIKLGCDICSALEICAEQNIIHRDIKPENIFLNKFGHFKLGDFGIARKLENSTGGLSQKGTFNYMAPEVAAGTHYGVGADIYSLGIVLYRLLNANRLPFLDNEQQVLNPEERKRAVERRIRGEKLTAPCQASPAMAAVVLRACDFDPSRRFATATEMKDALMAVKYGAPAPQPVSPAEEDLDRTVSVFSARAKADSPKPQPAPQPVQPQPAPQPVQPQPVAKPEPVVQPSNPDATAWDSTVNMGQLGGRNEAPAFRPQPESQPVIPPVVPEAPAAKPKSKKKRWLIIGGVVALIAVVAVVLILVLGDGSSSKKSSKNSDSSVESSEPVNTIVGKYKINTVIVYHETLGTEEARYDYNALVEAGYGDHYVEFKDDGTVFVYYDETQSYTLTYDDNAKVIIGEDGYTINYTHSGNAIVIDAADNEKWIYAK